MSARHNIDLGAACEHVDAATIRSVKRPAPGCEDCLKMGGRWLRAMFVYRAEFFALRPGLFFLAAGLVLTLPLSFGTISIGSVTFSLYWMLLGVTLAVMGMQSFCFGVLAQVLCDYSGRSRERWTRFFRYTPTVIASVAGIPPISCWFRPMGKSTGVEPVIWLAR